MLLDLRIVVELLRLRCLFSKGRYLGIQQAATYTSRLEYSSLKAY